MTHDEIIAYTRLLIPETTAAFVGAAGLLEALNSTLKRYAAEININNPSWYITSASVTLTANSQSASLPTGAVRVYFILDTGQDYKPLKNIPFNRVDPNDTSVPNACCITKDSIWFNSKPTTAQTYTCYYVAAPTEISSGSSEVDFYPMHHHLLAYEAAIICSIRKKWPIEDLLRMRDEALVAFRGDHSTHMRGIPNVPKDYWAINMTQGK
jgi:hypothetical protein